MYLFFLLKKKCVVLFIIYSFNSLSATTEHLLYASLVCAISYMSQACTNSVSEGMVPHEQHLIPPGSPGHLTPSSGPLGSMGGPVSPAQAVSTATRHLGALRHRQRQTWGPVVAPPPHPPIQPMETPMTLAGHVPNRAISVHRKHVPTGRASLRDGRHDHLAQACWISVLESETLPLGF